VQILPNEGSKKVLIRTDSIIPKPPKTLKKSGKLLELID
jgi:hypothetical protein